jgi:hypothetical protein
MRAKAAHGFCGLVLETRNPCFAFGSRDYSQFWTGMTDFPMKDLEGDAHAHKADRQ